MVLAVTESFPRYVLLTTMVGGMLWNQVITKWKIAVRMVTLGKTADLRSQKSYSPGCGTMRQHTGARL